MLSENKSNEIGNCVSIDEKRERAREMFVEGFDIPTIAIEVGVDKGQAQVWSRAGRWSFWRAVDRKVRPVEKRWRDRMKGTLEAMAALAEMVSDTFDADEIREATIGQRIVILRMTVEAMEKTAKMLGDEPVPASLENVGSAINMDPSRSAELLGRLGLRPVVAIPAPLEALPIDPGSSSIDKASISKAATDDKTTEV